MGAFERFMESWGLTTMAWMNSPYRVVRWAGILHGAVAMWIMLALMGLYSLRIGIGLLLRSAARRLLGKRNP